MSTSLNGRVALVTGSSSGLGLEIAKVLARNEARVILSGRDLEKLKTACAEVGKIALYPSKYRVVDSTDILSVQQIFLEEKHLDILVNNIGGAPKFGKFEDLTDEDWMNTFDLNVVSAVRFTREALPLLKKSRHGGRIINIASLPGIQPGRMNPDYASSKAALVNLTKCLANEFGPVGIRTNVICPSTLSGGGFGRNILDLMDREGIDSTTATRQILTSAAQKNPLGKVGTLADVANPVAFLCSDEAQFINGQCIAVDGGEMRGI